MFPCLSLLSLSASTATMLQRAGLFQEFGLYSWLWKEPSVPEKKCALAWQSDRRLCPLGCVGHSLIPAVFAPPLQEWYEEHSRKEESQTPLQEPASASSSSLKPLSLRQRSQTVI